MILMFINGDYKALNRSIWFVAVPPKIEKCFQQVTNNTIHIVPGFNLSYFLVAIVSGQWSDVFDHGAPDDSAPRSCRSFLAFLAAIVRLKLLADTRRKIRRALGMASASHCFCWLRRQVQGPFPPKDLGLSPCVSNSPCGSSVPDVVPRWV